MKNMVTQWSLDVPTSMCLAPPTMHGFLAN